MSDVTIQNDLSYLFLQWLGLDYNFWNVIFAEVILTVGFFVILFGVYFIVYLLIGD